MCHTPLAKMHLQIRRDQLARRTELRHVRPQLLPIGPAKIHLLRRDHAAVVHGVVRACASSFSFHSTLLGSTRCNDGDDDRVPNRLDHKLSRSGPKVPKSQS